MSIYYLVMLPIEIDYYRLEAFDPRWDTKVDESDSWRGILFVNFVP